MQSLHFDHLFIVRRCIGVAIDALKGKEKIPETVTSERNGGKLVHVRRILHSAGAKKMDVKSLIEFRNSLKE